MKRAIGAICLLLVLYFPLIAADLTISEPKPIYNLGDKLYVTVTDIKGSEQGNFNIDLECNNNTINLLKVSARAFALEGGQSYSIPYKYLDTQDLEINNIKKILGTCNIQAQLGSEEAESLPFTVTDNISVNAQVNKVRFNPGEDAQLTIQANRADAEPFSGYYKINNFTQAEGTINDGKIEKEITIEPTMQAGHYTMQIEVYDTDINEEKRNHASTTVLIAVNQVPTELKLGISDVDVIPGKGIAVIPQILDQSNNPMPGSITAYLTDTNENKREVLLFSGEETQIQFPTNATPGTWSIYAFTNALNVQQDINVLGIGKINYSIDGSTLTVINVGNVNYDGIVNIKIGEQEHQIQVDLKLGESKEYVLEAPQGQYEIAISDGDSSFRATGFLTGNTIGIKEKGGAQLFSLSFLWIFLICIVGGLGFVMVGMSRRTVVTDSKMSFTQKMKGAVGKIGAKIRHKKAEKQIDNTMIDMSKVKEKRLKEAESALAISGQKTNTSIIAINIKDKDSFNEEIQDKIVHIIKESCSKVGVVDVKEDIIYIIYSPLLTKKENNEVVAIQAAYNIQQKLKSLQKTLSTEFHFGIAVHTGELISKRDGEKLKYASMDKILTTINTIAQKAQDNILITDKVRNATRRDARVIREEDIGTTKTYSLESIINREKDKQKLKDLLSRKEHNQPNQGNKTRTN